MLFEQVAFGPFALVTLVSSLGVVLARYIWHSALLLGLALSRVAVHDVMLAAAFAAVIHVLLYAGGLLALVTFRLVLARPDAPRPSDVGAIHPTRASAHTVSSTRVDIPSPR